MMEIKERLKQMEKLLNDYYDNLDDPFATTDIAIAVIEKTGWLLEHANEQVERVQELEKERNEYKNALHEVRSFPTYMTKGQYVARGTKISNKVLKKWRNTNA